MLLRSTQLYLLLITGILLTACTPQYSGKVPPKVVNGEIDLTGWDFEKDGPVKLDGDWLFAWEKFVEPGSWEQLQQTMPNTVAFPRGWSDLDDPKNPAKKMLGTGYASYAVKLKLAQTSDLGIIYSDYISPNALRLLSDSGKSIAEVQQGVPSVEPINEIPVGFKSNILRLANLQLKVEKPKVYTLLLHISSHLNSLGGPGYPLTLGRLKLMESKHKLEVQLRALTFGILLVVSLFHIILFIQRPKDKSAFYFAILSGLFALRTFVLGLAQNMDWYQSKLGFITLVRLDFMLLALGPVLPVYFAYSLIKVKYYKKLSEYSFYISLFFILFALLFPTQVFTGYFLAYIFFITLVASFSLGGLVFYSIKKDSMAIIILFFSIFPSLGIINDILHAQGIIRTDFVMPYTFIIFILYPAGLISYNSAKAHKTAEHLTEKLSAEVAAQTKKLNRIQYLSQQIQNTSDLDTMIKNLTHVLVTEFTIPGYSFLLLNKEKNQLESFRIEAAYRIPEKIKLKLYSTPLSVGHSKSLHGAIIKKGKPYFLSRLFEVENAPDEMKNRELLGMQSLFLLPLKIDGAVFAALSMSDTKFQEKDRIKFLSKEERAELVQLSQFVSSALYQALQKEQIEQAQAAASRAKNEAAINQLAAHLAHEVNNPLNYIATGKIMQSDSFEKHHAMILDVLTGDDEDSLAFKEELEKLQDKFNRGLEQTNEGQDRIAKVIAEIRAITGVDGLNFTNFDIVPIVNEEIVYSLHRNQVKIGEQAIKVTGTDNPIEVLSNQHILARSIRTVISNCIHFAREHKGNEGELYIDCKIDDNMLLMEIGNNSFSIKTKQVEDMFDLEKSKPYGTEQIGLAMIKELLHKISADLVLADHGRESGKVIFQLQVPLEI